MTEKITPQGASSPYKPVSKDHAAKEDKRLRQACADFEAMFVYQLLKTMKKVIPQGGCFPFPPVVPCGRTCFIGRSRMPSLITARD